VLELPLNGETTTLTLAGALPQALMEEWAAEPVITPEIAQALADEGARDSAEYMRRTRKMVGQHVHVYCTMGDVTVCFSCGEPWPERNARGRMR
jgi:cytosine/adenosine deaminase-related metal-dependent hydrolase